jgi:predicted transposase/invertase (TIGR01784 family)
MTERTLYYWAREYVSGIKEGEDYSELPRVITINIVDFDHVKLNNFHTAFRLREDTYRDYVLTEALEIHFLNMVKFRKLENKDMNNALCRWLTYFDVRTPEQELKEEIKMDTAIQKAQTRLEQVTHDNEFMHNYTLRQMAMSDWTTGVNTAFERGIEKGATQRNFEVAKNLLHEGLSVEIIQKTTGLDMETIIALQNEK